MKTPVCWHSQQVVEDNTLRDQILHFCVSMCFRMGFLWRNILKGVLLLRVGLLVYHKIAYMPPCFPTGEPRMVWFRQVLTKTPTRVQHQQPVGLQATAPLQFCVRRFSKLTLVPVLPGIAGSSNGQVVTYRHATTSRVEYIGWIFSCHVFPFTNVEMFNYCTFWKLHCGRVSVYREISLHYAQSVVFPWSEEGKLGFSSMTFLKIPENVSKKCFFEQVSNSTPHFVKKSSL